jgi:hypothetical protein
MLLEIGSISISSMLTSSRLIEEVSMIATIVSPNIMPGIGQTDGLHSMVLFRSSASCYGYGVRLLPDLLLLLLLFHLLLPASDVRSTRFSSVPFLLLSLSLSIRPLILPKDGMCNSRSD